MYPYGPQQNDNEFRLEDSPFSSSSRCLRIDTDFTGFPFFSERHYKLFVSIECFQNDVTAAILASPCRCSNPILMVLSFFRNLTLIPIKLHCCWPRKLKRSVFGYSCKSIELLAFIYESEQYSTIA